MAEKKRQKSIEELCRSRVYCEKWPARCSQASNHTILPRTPSPRESFSRGRRRVENARHSLLSSRPLSGELRTKFNTHDLEKQKMHQGTQEHLKKTFFPGISQQVVTHADPPFPATDTQPLPPINLPRPQDCAADAFKQGKNSKPFTIHGQQVFESGAVYDITFGASGERARKRKLEALKRVEDQEHVCSHSVSRQQSESRCKSKCLGAKKGKKGSRRITKPFAWKSPSLKEKAADSDMGTDC